MSEIDEMLKTVTIRAALFRQRNQHRLLYE